MLSLLLILSGVSNLLAQLAPVPTPNYSFDTPLPPGWFSQLLIGTSVNTTYTGTAACTSPSCRLDNTGEFVLIHFASQPGPVNYKIKASVGGTVTSFVGTFSIQESADSINWAPLRQFTDGQMATSCTPYTDIPATNTRYIRFYFTNKMSGANVALDDISVAVPSVAGPAINVLQGGMPVINNGFVQVQSPVGVNTPFSLGIQNFGTTNTLNISSVSITGPAASDFVVTNTLTSVAPSSISNLNIDFTPSAAGSRNATLQIISNDANQSTYTININGVGGMYVSEPPAQPSALTFSEVKTYRFKGSFSTSAAPVDFYGGYLVVRGKNGAPLTPPSDGKVYMRGDTVGNDGIVTRVSKDSVFYPISIHANTTYQFRVYAFNGGGPATNYKQNNPLSGSVTTPATMMPAGEYSGINTGSSTFINDLHNLINPHTSIYYSNYASTIGNKFEVRDTTHGRTAVTCRYTTFTAVFTNGMTFGTADSSFSREHTYAHSWMPTYPADNPERPEYNDQHHLFPVKFINANNIRSNYPFGTVVTVTNSFMGGKLGLDANNQSVYEPKDSHKGDLARALFYMAVCYNSVDGNNWKFQVEQNQDILKKWNFDDPPSNMEISRNDIIDSIQGNRNPFVDHPEYACYIDFSNMTYISNPSVPCNNLSVGPGLEETGFVLYPTPTQNELHLSFVQNAKGMVTLSDINGRTILQTPVQNSNTLTLTVDHLAPGIYWVGVQQRDGILRKRFVKE